MIQARSSDNYQKWGNMPTLNWIQETAIDRYYETGFDKKESALSPATYPCRQCSEVFKTIQLRDIHELGHPVKNPRFCIQGKELIGKEYTITTKLSREDIKANYIDYIKINGTVSSLDDLSTILSSESNNYFEISYSNEETAEKRVNIHICIADNDELNSIDSYFEQYFSCDDFTGKEIEKFRVATQNFNSTKNYANGIISYLHGIMAKDQRAERIGFEDFFNKFNQASDSLQNYRTSLSIALRSVISFNYNIFENTITGMLALDQAISFFQDNHVTMKEANSIEKSLRLPVDSATAFIVEDLISYFDKKSLEDIETTIRYFNDQYTSQQDLSKLSFIAFKKAINEGNKLKIDFYSKKLKNDSVFLPYYEKKQ